MVIKIQKLLTIFISSTEELIGFHTVADFRVRQHPHAVVGVFFQIFHSQILIIGFNDLRVFFINVIGGDVKYFIASYFPILTINRRWRPCDIN